MELTIKDLSQISSSSKRASEYLVRENGLNTILNGTNQPYNYFSKKIEKIFDIITGRGERVSIRWKYELDNDTGLKILRTVKDPDALGRVRNMADELFK